MSQNNEYWESLINQNRALIIKCNFLIKKNEDLETSHWRLIEKEKNLMARMVHCYHDDRIFAYGDYWRPYADPDPKKAIILIAYKKRRSICELKKINKILSINFKKLEWKIYYLEELIKKRVLILESRIIVQEELYIYEIVLNSSQNDDDIPYDDA